MTAASPTLPASIATPSPAGLVPVATACVVYAVLLLAGDQLLRDPDTFWQVTIGGWIVDHRAVPRDDIYSWTMSGAPWISTQWLSQIAIAASYRAMGWGGPVVLSAAAVAAAFGLLARFVGRWLPPIPTLVLMSAAFALAGSHLLARPHVLAMPIMVVFVGGLIAALDRRSAPPFALLPLVTLWANVHGGFVFGIALIAPIGLGAVLGAAPEARRPLLLRWGVFGLAALALACVTPYGWDSILASQRILNLGQALALISEWRAADFGHPAALEIVVLGGIALALLRGFKLDWIRTLLLVGLVLMALGHVRNAEVLALLAPMLLARPLAEQTGVVAAAAPGVQRPTWMALVLLLAAGTTATLSMHRYRPSEYVTPAAAVRVLKERGIARVLNDYDFGGYLISQGIAPYIDGRTELYGEAQMVAHNNFIWALNADDFFGIIADKRVEATLLRPQNPGTKFMDHLDGWARVHSDDVAVIHVRTNGAMPAAAPRLRPSLD